MALNTSGTCEHCAGTVRNIEGRRLTIEALTLIHDQTCPGLRRTIRTTRKDTDHQ